VALPRVVPVTTFSAWGFGFRGIGLFSFRFSIGKKKVTPPVSPSA
jgi:hypothetical protein